MFVRYLPGIMACAVLAAPATMAQQATQAVQAQQQVGVSQNVQGGFQSASDTTGQPASAWDPDIGKEVMLQSEPKYQPFSAWTNWNVFWTNNAALLNGSQGSDTFMSGTLGGGYMPHLGANLFLDLSVEQSLFRYARNSSLDFNSLQTKAGLVYVVPALGDLAIFGDYSYDLLTVRGFNKQIYADHTLSVGARKVFSLGSAQLLYTSASADFAIGGEPNYALRNEYAVLVGYQLAITRAVKFDLYYRAAAQDYTDSGRADFNQLMGGGITYEITKWLSVQALSTMGINTSNDSTYSYFAANLGGGVGILVNF
jgi:hypothetical protein